MTTRNVAAARDKLLEAAGDWSRATRNHDQLVEDLLVAALAFAHHVRHEHQRYAYGSCSAQGVAREIESAIRDDREGVRRAVHP